MNLKLLCLSLVSLSLFVSTSLTATAATQKAECQNLSGGNCGGDTNRKPDEVRIKSITIELVNY